MVEFRWIQMSLFLMLELQFTGAAARDLLLFFTVRAGEEVTLSCESVIEGQNKCNATTWIFSDSGKRAAVELINLGQIGVNAKEKSDRLSVTENCSLVIKKVTAEDAGRYTCRQFIISGGEQQGSDSLVHLSVINMTEHKDDDKVTLNCSVSTHGRCKHTVKWLFQGKDVGKDNKDMKTSQSLCYASVTFLTSHYIYTSRYKVFTCEVTDGDKVPQFPLSPQSSGEKPGEDTTTTTTTATTRTTTKSTRTTENFIKTGTKDVSTEQRARTGRSVLDYIMLVMRVAELLLITVITVLLIRAAGNQRPPDDNTVFYSVRSRTVRRSGPAASQVNNDEDDGEVNYENFGDTSTSVRLH